MVLFTTSIVILLVVHIFWLCVGCSIIKILLFFSNIFWILLKERLVWIDHLKTYCVILNLN